MKTFASTNSSWFLIVADVLSNNIFRQNRINTGPKSFYSLTGYLYNGFLYTGGVPGSGPTVGLASNTVNELVSDMHDSARNIAADNFFTDIKLVDELL